MIKRIIKKYGINILAFTIPFLIMLVIFIALKTFTKYVSIQSDLQAQYISFLNYFKQLMTGHEGIYTFSNGLRRKYVWNYILLFI